MFKKFALENRYLYFKIPVHQCWTDKQTLPTYKNRFQLEGRSLDQRMISRHTRQISLWIVKISTILEDKLQRIIFVYVPVSVLLRPDARCGLKRKHVDKNVKSVSWMAKHVTVCLASIVCQIILECISQSSFGIESGNVPNDSPIWKMLNPLAKLSGLYSDWLSSWLTKCFDGAQERGRVGINSSYQGVSTHNATKCFFLFSFYCLQTPRFFPFLPLFLSLLTYFLIFYYVYILGTLL